MRKILTLIIAISIALGFTACSNSGSKADNGKQVVKIGYLPITHALAVFQSKEILDNDSTKNYQVELVKFGSWTDLTDALNSGRIDGASVLIELAMSAKSKGINLKALALGHKDGNVLVVGNNINSAEEIKGKKFAIPNTQSSHNILLNDALKKNGLSISDIQVVQLSPTEMPYSLSNNSIDGYCVAEPFGAMSVCKKFGHVLYSSEELWDHSQCCALVFNGKFIKANKAIVDDYYDVYNEAGKQLNADAAKKIASKYLGGDDEVITLSLKWISYDDLAITKEDYDKLVDRMKEYNVNPNPPTFEDFVYSK